MQHRRRTSNRKARTSARKGSRKYAGLQEPVLLADLGPKPRPYRRVIPHDLAPWESYWGDYVFLNKTLLWNHHALTWKENVCPPESVDSIEA